MLMRFHGILFCGIWRMDSSSFVRVLESDDAVEDVEERRAAD